MIKRKILNDFVEPIVSQLFQRTQEYQKKLQRKLKKRRRKKLKDLKRKDASNPLITSKSDCTKEPQNYNFNLRVDNLLDSSFQCDTFVDSDFSMPFYFDFSDPIDFGQEAVKPRNLLTFNCNYNKRSRRFNKAHRKRSCRKNSYRNNSLHPSHHPIDLSSRSDVLGGEIDLFSKGSSFCPTPSDINWNQCHLDWQAFVDRLRWADFFFDRNGSNTFDTPGNNHEDLGPFSIKSNNQAPINKDIALETFLATIENKLFDIKRARTRPISNLSKLARTAMNQLRSSNDISVRLQDKGSSFVILDRQDYIDKVESNLNDGSFDVLPSDPSIILTEAVKNWGEKWINN